MTDFRAFNPCTGETFYAGGGMVARHRAWELATLFVTTDPRWEHDEAVHLVIKDVVAVVEDLDHQQVPPSDENEAESGTG